MEAQQEAGVDRIEIAWDRLVQRPVSGACPCARFRCGESLVDDWLRKKAFTHHDQGRARVVTFRHEGDDQLLGFYSAQLILEKEKKLRAHKDMRPWSRDALFPAMHIGFLGVDAACQGQGLGSLMLQDAIAAFALIADKAGVPLLTIQPLRPELIPYYAARNFTAYGTEGAMMMSSETALALQ